MKNSLLTMTFTSTAILLSGCKQEEKLERFDLSGSVRQINSNEWQLVNDRQKEGYLAEDDLTIIPALGVVQCEPFSNISTVDSVTIEFNVYNGVVTFENNKGGFDVMTIADAKELSPDLIPEAAKAYYDLMHTLNFEVPSEIEKAIQIHAPSIHPLQTTTHSATSPPTAE